MWIEQTKKLMQAKERVYESAKNIDFISDYHMKNDQFLEGILVHLGRFYDIALSAGVVSYLFLTYPLRQLERNNQKNKQSLQK